MSGARDQAALRVLLWPLLVVSACTGHITAGVYASQAIDAGQSGSGGDVGTGGDLGDGTGGNAGTSAISDTGGITGTSGTGGSVDAGASGGSGGSRDAGTGMDSSPPDTGGTDTVVTNLCGNGRIDPGENCEGSNLNGGTCAALGFLSGSLTCGAACLFDTTVCVTAPTTPKLNVKPSRTSCTAPCAVFFDATGTTGLAGATSRLTGGDYVGASFSWNFNDNNTRHPTTTGFAVAHVFELPGTYQVSVQVRDTAGVAAAGMMIPITVTSMSGTTYYVASNGSDANNGTSPSTPFQTPAKGMTKATTNNSVLFRRGDKFLALKSSLGFNKVTGPVLIGAYSDPTAASSTNPILDFSGASLVEVSNSSDIRIVDLQFTKTGSAGGITMSGTSTNSLFLRIDAQHDLSQNAAAIVFSTGTTTGDFVVDSHLHHVTGYGWYGEGHQKAALIGTTIDDLSGTYHGFRWQSCTEASPGVCSNGYFAGSLEYVAENAINNPSSFTSGEFHGDNSNIVMVGNTVVNNLSASPQNTASVEYLSNVLFDGNLVNGAVSISIAAKHVVIRNNVMVGTYSGAVTMLANPQLTAGWTDEIYIYNNTVYGTPPFMSWVYASPGSVTISNNIFYNTQSSGSFLGAGVAKVTENHNLTYAPNAKSWIHPSGTGDVYGDPGFASVDPSNAKAFRMSATSSPAVNAGAPVGAYLDNAGTSRPQGAAFDIGAFELVP